MIFSIFVIIVLVIAICALIAGISALCGWLFMLLWNFVMPAFWPNAPQVDFLHAWGAWVLLCFVGGVITWVRQK